MFSISSHYSRIFIDRRKTLVAAALDWEMAYGIAPQITSCLSEIDAALLIGMQIDPHSSKQLENAKLSDYQLEPTYADIMQGKSAVRKGFDFEFKGKRIQVKANRPSGKPGSKVTLAPKPKNLEWDYLIYMLYKQNYDLLEAWLWSLDDYKKYLEHRKRISPDGYRLGLKINIEIPLQQAIHYPFNLSAISENEKKRFHTGEISSCEMIRSIESNLHAAMIDCVGQIIQQNRITLPNIAVLFDLPKELLFFRVYGMYGGFKIWVDQTQPNLALYAYAFSRIHEGAERLYKVDTNGFKLIWRDGHLHLD